MENYEELCEIGSGTFGSVSKCRDIRSGKIVAIKKHLDKKRIIVKIAIKREYSLLCKVPHENIVTLIDAFVHRGFLHGVYEHLKQSVHDEMNTKFSCLDKVTLRRYSYQLLRAVDFLHQNNIMHRDIKPDNLLVSHSGVLKLGDFGNARRLVRRGRLLTPMPCARTFSSPEMLLEDSYSTPADVWAIGCSILFMAKWSYFLDGTTDHRQLKDIIRKIGPLTEQQELLYFKKFRRSAVRPINKRQDVSLSDKYGLYDADLAKLVDECLQMDPANRLSCAELLQQMYFTRDNFLDTFIPELQEMIQKDLAYVGSEDSASSLDSWDDYQLKVEEGSDTSLPWGLEQQEVDVDSSTSQQDVSAPCTKKSTKDKKAKKGIKGAFRRALRAVRGFFTRRVCPEDDNHRGSQGDGPVEELRTAEPNVAGKSGTSPENVARPQEPNKNGMWKRIKDFFRNKTTLS